MKFRTQSIFQRSVSGLLGVIVAIGTGYIFEGIRDDVNGRESVFIGISLLMLSVSIFLLNQHFLIRVQDKKNSDIKLQVRIAQKAALEVLGHYLERELGVKVNIRLYLHRRVDGEDRLYQDKEINRLSVMRSSEEPFTYISAKEENMVMCEAFNARHHIIRSLESVPINSYSDRARKAIDPAQKWILAVPLVELRADATIDEQLIPTAILAIYSNVEIDFADHDKIDNVIYSAQQAARTLSSINAISSQLI